MTEEKKSKRMPTISHVLCWTCLHLDPPNYQLWPWLGYLSSVTVSPFVLLCTSDLTIRYNRLKLILTLKNADSQMFEVDEMFTFVTIASSNRGLNLGIWGFSFFAQFVEIHIHCSKCSCFRALGYHQKKPK